MHTNDDPAVVAAQRAYDATLATAMDAAQERHHIDRGSAYWVAKGTHEVQAAALALEEAEAGALVRAVLGDVSTATEG